MKYLEYNDLENHELSIKIFAVIQKKLDGRGNQYFDGNLDFDKLLEQLIDIYYSLYLVETDDFDVLKFKNKYKEFKKESFRGKIQINPIISDRYTPKREADYYSGEYTFFLVLFYNLFSNVFRKQIVEKNSPFFELDTFFKSEISPLRQAPNCYIIFDGVERIMDDGEIDYEDFKLYVKKITDLIKERASDDKEIIEKVKDFDIEELDTIGKKIIMMNELGVLDFLIEKFDLEENNNKLSNIIHSFTGLGVSSINSTINPIYNTSNIQKNNPYNNIKNLAKIKAKMLELHLNK